ncbi:hypothetical protein [Halobacteriovorax sp. JY17]|uniref:hypothetical protein n=1 Tax=Halobacteriovorax sp. JY17 TaxID=2014617 RepID=UPI000C4B76AB|nr:hypothetical protein [Halobacteriovorax sp. JY17]PIK15989.1 MAG: hypothetical protein CES88_04470 [Halobacteriovorax sp. JY17]
MIEYEVTVDITDTDREAYKLWLDTYTSETKRLPGFIDVKCSVTKVLNNYYSCIRYIVKDKYVLEEFIANKEKTFLDIDRALKKRILNEGDI